jgi:hypothetical protein
MSNESKKPEAASQLEPSAANRRAFMKTVVTGTVAAGLAASASTAQAASASPAAASCSTALKFPAGPASVKVLVNRNGQMTIDRLWEIIHGTFGESGCPACGLIGYPNPNPDVGTISNVSIEMAYLREDVDSMVVIQDAGSSPCSK